MKSRVPHLFVLICAIFFLAPGQATADECVCYECQIVNVPDPDNLGSPPSPVSICLDLVDGGARQCTSGDIGCFMVGSCWVYNRCDDGRDPFPTVNHEPSILELGKIDMKLAAANLSTASFEVEQQSCLRGKKPVVPWIKAEEGEGVTYTF